MTINFTLLHGTPLPPPLLRSEDGLQSRILRPMSDSKWCPGDCDELEDCREKNRKLLFGTVQTYPPKIDDIDRQLEEIYAFRNQDVVHVFYFIDPKTTEPVFCMIVDDMEGYNRNTVSHGYLCKFQSELSENPYDDNGAFRICSSTVKGKPIGEFALTKAVDLKDPGNSFDTIQLSDCIQKNNLQYFQLKPGTSGEEIFDYFRNLEDPNKINKESLSGLIKDNKLEYINPEMKKKYSGRGFEYLKNIEY